MTNPFRSTANHNGDSGVEYTTAASEGVANQVGIFFVNWRHHNLPTSHTPEGKEAEVVNVDFINLRTFQVFQNIWIRQVYLIRAFKNAGIGNMAIGRIKFTPPQIVGNKATQAKYEWEDYSGVEKAVVRGVDWLNSEAGKAFTPTQMPDFSRNQTNEQQNQANANVGQGTSQPTQGGGTLPAQSYQPNQNQATAAAPASTPQYGADPNEDWLATPEPRTANDMRQNQPSEPPSVDW